jgi:hypothetical protein
MVVTKAVLVLPAASGGGRAIYLDVTAILLADGGLSTLSIAFGNCRVEIMYRTFRTSGAAVAARDRIIHMARAVEIIDKREFLQLHGLLYSLLVTHIDIKMMPILCNPMAA